MLVVKKIVASKKFWVSLVGLIIAILAANGIIVPPGTEAIALKIIAAVVGSFNIGQGIADGLSKGATSAGK